MSNHRIVSYRYELDNGTTANAETYVDSVANAYLSWTVGSEMMLGQEDTFGEPGTPENA